MRIKDSFVVVGSKKSGRVTLVADEYAKGHIQNLRVDDKKRVGTESNNSPCPHPAC